MNFGKSLNSFLISLEVSAGDIFKRGTCKVSFQLKHSGYHFSGGKELLHEAPQNMKIMKILKIMIFSRLWLSEHGSGASERCAKAQCSNNLQRRGFELNTPPRPNRRGQHPDFTGKFDTFFLNFAKSLNSFFIRLGCTREKYKSEVHAKSLSN